MFSPWKWFRRTRSPEWRTNWHCISLTLFWKRRRELINSKEQWRVISCNINSRTCGCLKRNAQETEQQHCRKAQIVALGRQKARAQKAEHFLVNVTQQRKGRAKDINQEVRQVERDSSAERLYARKTGKSPSGKEDRPPCFKYKRGNCCHDGECEHWHPPRCKEFKNEKCQMGKDCPFIHSQKKKRSTTPQRKEKGKV